MDKIGTDVVGALAKRAPNEFKIKLRDPSPFDLIEIEAKWTKAKHRKPSPEELVQMWKLLKVQKIMKTTSRIKRTPKYPNKPYI